MAIEKVKYDIKVFDNFIEIIPKDGMKDNSIYEIKLKGLRCARSGDEIDNIAVKFVSAMSPMYCGIMDVASLLDIVDIPEDIVLYNIREASKYAEYIFSTTNKKINPNAKIDKNNIPFAVKEFTRFKAAKDCLLKIYMNLINDNVVEGTLGEVVFKTRDQLPNIKKILEYLDTEIAKWLDAIRGFDLEGRARMQTAIKGYHHGGRRNPMTSYEKYNTPKGIPIGLNRGTY